MKLKENRLNNKSIFFFFKLKIFYISLICLVLFLLLYNVSIEIYYMSYINFSQFLLSDNIFYDIKSDSSIGWFSLEENEEYKFWKDYSYIFLQNMITPTILEDHGYNKRIICHYTSRKQLASFCEKNKQYKLLKKILTNYALFERR